MAIYMLYSTQLYGPLQLYTVPVNINCWQRISSDYQTYAELGCIDAVWIMNHFKQRNVLMLTITASTFLSSSSLSDPDSHSLADFFRHQTDENSSLEKFTSSPTSVHIFLNSIFGVRTKSKAQPESLSESEDLNITRTRKRRHISTNTALVLRLRSKNPQGNIHPLFDEPDEDEREEGHHALLFKMVPPHLQQLASLHKMYLERQMGAGVASSSSS
jgi:hypothetical protein